MDDGEFAFPGDCRACFARHYFVWGQSSSRDLRSIDGHWGVLWAAGWNHCQGDL